MLLAKDVHAFGQLVIGDGPGVRLERDWIRRLIVPQFDFWLDFDRRSKSERCISFDFDTLERRNLDDNRRDTRLSNGTVVEIRHQATNDILLDRFGIALL